MSNPSLSTRSGSTVHDLDTVVDFALTHGLIKRADDSGVSHSPVTLQPCPIDAWTCAAMRDVTAPFNRLAHDVANDLVFLREALAHVVTTDEFTRRLLELAQTRASAQPWRFAITRSDYFLQADSAREHPLIRQVELNTIAASYLGLAGAVTRFHQSLLSLAPTRGRLVPNDPLATVARAFADVFAHYGHDDACVLMVVQPDERNVFDQRLLEIALAAHGIPVERAALETIGEHAVLRDGHLTLNGRIAAITYFRAGYRPQDLQTEIAWTARARIEASSTISVPDIALQLSGTKKVQQLLTKPAVLRAFCTEDDAQMLEATFAGMFTLEQPIQSQDPEHRDTQSAWQDAIHHPDRYVLKPQREGGGFNFYGDHMAQHLARLTPEQRDAYVLMERIRPIQHTATCLADGRLSHGPVVSEIGRFGVLFARGDEVGFNRDAGYLVRTKHTDANEGGVSSGAGHLDSLRETTIDSANP